MLTFTPLLQVTLDLTAEASKYEDLQFVGASGPGLFIARILAAIMAIAAVIVLIALISGAIEWMNSSGDKGKIEKAREKMTQAIIGIIVLAATIAIFNLVQSFLGINVISFDSGQITRTAPRRPNVTFME